MRELEVGDTVRYISGRHGDGKGNPLWNGVWGRIEGTIVNIGTYMPYKVNWGNGQHNTYYKGDLELVIRVPEDLFQM